MPVRDRQEQAIAALKHGCVPFDDDYAAIGMIEPEFITYEIQDGFYHERIVTESLGGSARNEFGGSPPTEVLGWRTERLETPMPRIKRVTELVWRPCASR